MALTREQYTKRFLAEVPFTGWPLSQTPLLAALYGGKYVSRPAFLGAEELDRLIQDVEVLRGCLTALPDLLFGGDLAAFARAVGMNEVQTAAIVRTAPGGRPATTRMTRADLYADPTGFRLLEFNVGSTLGGTENVDLCRAFLEDPEVAAFVAEHRLSHVDTLAEQVRTVLVESGVPEGSRPVVALTEWPCNFSFMEPYLRLFADRWSELGLETLVCDISQLTENDGELFLKDRRIDIVYRQFMIEDLLDPQAPALLEPTLRAVEHGGVKMFTPLDAELFGSKGALAMLSDQANRTLWTEQQLASLDRLLPWTRMVTSGPVALEDGSEVDLVEYALAHQADLVLKPTLLHGGYGVLPGWLPEVTAQEWRTRLLEALDGPYVIQRRIRPVPELFAGPDGLEPWTVVWGLYTMAGGYGGVWLRCLPDDDAGVVNHARGALVGCSYYPTDGGL